MDHIAYLSTFSSKIKIEKTHHNTNNFKGTFLSLLFILVDILGHSFKQIIAKAEMQKKKISKSLQFRIYLPLQKGMSHCLNKFDF